MEILCYLTAFDCAPNLSDVYLNAVWHRLNWIQCCRTILMILNSEWHLLQIAFSTYAYLYIHIHLRMTETQTHRHVHQPYKWEHIQTHVCTVSTQANAIRLNSFTLCGKFSANRNHLLCLCVCVCVCIENLHFPSSGKPLQCRCWFSTPTISSVIHLLSLDD